MLLESLDSAATRKIQYPLDLEFATQTLAETLTINADYVRTLRAFQQAKALGGISSLGKFNRKVNRSDGLMMTPWSTLCAADLAAWQTSHYMNIDISHRALNAAGDTSIRGLAFLLNHPDMFYQVLMVDPGSSTTLLDTLTAENKDAFARSFAHHFGDEVPTKLPQLPPLYTAAVTERSYGIYTIDALVVGKFALHPIWSGMRYIPRKNDPRPPHLRDGNVIDVV